MTKLVGFIGGPCTGKTTLAEKVMLALEAQQYNAAWSKEFVTDDIPINGIPDLDYYVYEQFRFCYHQHRIEENAREQADIVITDSPLLIGYIYALEKAATSLKGRQNRLIQDFEKLIEQDKHRYHHLYLLTREGAYEDNATRFHSLEESIAMDKLIEETLNKHNIPYTILSGDAESRTSAVMDDIVKISYIDEGRTTFK